VARDLSGKVLVVTGASSGIGAATAVACAHAGMDVVLNGRQTDALAAVADQIDRLGHAAEIVVGDVTAPGLNGRLLDVAQERFGHFDVVFANAGYGFKKPEHELEMAELRQIFELNFFAGFELLRAAARRLIAERRRGHLLMCSSALAKFSVPDFAAYSATKAAQNHFCRSMRMELRRYGIEVASVHPINTATAFTDRAIRYSGQVPDESSRKRTLPRWFTQSPETVAGAVVRCLRRPRPEVWTSWTTRLGLGLMMVFPRLMDAVGRHAYRG
jgi:short-subunit dehydrogenase